MLLEESHLGCPLDAFQIANSKRQRCCRKKLIPHYTVKSLMSHIFNCIVTHAQKYWRDLNLIYESKLYGVTITVIGQLGR